MSLFFCKSLTAYFCLFLFCNLILVLLCLSFSLLLFHPFLRLHLLAAFSFVPIFPVCLLMCPVPVGRGLGPTLPPPPPPQQVEGCLVLQNSMAFWEWDNASPPPNKPPKKSASASCLVCEGAASVVDSLSQTPPLHLKPHSTLYTHSRFPTVLKVKHFYRDLLCNSTLVFALSYTYLKGTVHLQFNL